MKRRLIVFNKKILLILLITAFLCTSLSIFLSTKTTIIPAEIFSIVIDAGHGGIDGGCVGKTTGVTESKLNLDYSLQLKAYCEDFGMKVILTRSTMEGLYSPFATNKKRSEMQAREKIIKGSNADLLISIHMNSVSLKSVKGAQVFYKQNSIHGKEFAEELSNSLSKRLNCLRGESKEGDFYVLNCNNKPAVLVECGYLSNPEEEILLATDNYKKEFCLSLFYGILNFLKM